MRLDEKALLARVHIGVWKGKKKAKEVEEEIDDLHKSKGAVSVRKKLMDSDELRALITTVGEARDLHHKLTAPWNEDGTGILSIELHQQYLEGMRALKDKYQEQTKDFVAIYEDLIDKEEERCKKAVSNGFSLGTLFNREDYPSKQMIARKFHFDIWFFPVPTKDDFRSKLQADELEAIKEGFEKQQKTILTEVARDSYEKLYEVVKKMYERLEDPDAVFRDSLVKNIADVVAVLPKLNFAGDPKLSELTQLAEEELASLDPQDLRKSKKLRQLTVDLTKEMLKEMDQEMEALL